MNLLHPGGGVPTDLCPASCPHLGAQVVSSPPHAWLHTEQLPVLLSPVTMEWLSLCRVWVY